MKQKLFLLATLSLGIYAITLPAAADRNTALINGSENITLPDETLLTQRLLENGFDDFVEATKLPKKLAHKTLDPLQIVACLDASLDYYSAYHKNDSIMNRLMQLKKRHLLELILEEHKATLSFIANTCKQD